MPRNTKPAPRKKRPTVYILGGLSRTGKTTVTMKLMRRRRLVVFSTDTIRRTIRGVLTGEPNRGVERVTFRGYVTIREPGNKKLRKIPFGRKDQSEDDLAWEGARAIIMGYDRPGRGDLLVEGVAVTPERVYALKLKNLKVRAAFFGYSKESHLDSILAYSKKRKDRIYKWIHEHGGDDSQVRKWVEKGIVTSKQLQKSARKFGYRYFDISGRPFREHVANVLTYLDSRQT